MLEAIPDLAAALKQLKARLPAYQLYHAYADGQHRLAFATDKFRNTFGSLFRAFADNMCAGVVDAAADRLVVTGYAIEGVDATEPEEKRQASDAWDIWRANRMDERAGEVHREALMSGDGYVIVWPGADGAPTIYPNDAANMTVRYDPETPGKVMWAAKVWVDDDAGGRLRVNLYYPDRIEKYITRGKAQGLPDHSNNFVPYEVPGEAWPLQNPYDRVPVFHFATNGRVGRTGRSELADVVPLQDALNKSVADMLVAGEYMALPQRYATGLEVEIDPDTGKPKPLFIPGTDRVWATEGEGVRFGQFEAADLEPFLQVQAGFRQQIAVVSRTPLHFIIPPAGDWPSGEALKSAEGAFLKKIRDRQIAFGNVWEDVMRFALQVAGKPDIELDCEWENPAPRDELSQANAAVLKSQIGVPDKQLWRELGYNEKQIEQMLADKEANAEAFGAQLLGAFERGDGNDDEKPAGRQDAAPSRRQKGQ